jgi:hypothetical protein
MVTASSIPDIGLKAAQLRTNGIGWLDSETKSLLGTLKGRSGDVKAVSDMLASHFESMPQQLAHKLTSSDSQVGLLSKALEKSYRLFGISFYDEINRRSFGTTLGRHLYLMSEKKWGGLHKSLQKNLNENGISEKEWDLMRSPENIQAPVSNKKYVLPSMARDYSKESIARYLDKNVNDLTAKDIANTKQTLEFNQRMYFANNTANINMFPGAVERSLMHLGTTPNTALGQVVRTIMQFKGFIISYTRRHLGRIFGDAIENGFKLGDTFNWSDARHLSALVASTTVYGYLAFAIKDMLAGKTPPAPDHVKTWMRALVQGGGFGIYGDFLAGSYGRSAGQSFVDSLAGPTLGGTANSAAELYTRLKELDHPGTALYYFAKQNTPLLNAWFSKAAFDYMFLYGIQEKLSPGSIGRMQRRMDKDFGQSFMFDPQQYAKHF